MLKLSDFDYNLPIDLIAQHPLEKRSSSKMFVLNRSSSPHFEHSTFDKLKNYLKKGDLLVLNDTKVLTCRLMGKKISGGRVEVFLTKRLDSTRFQALIQPSRTKIGEKIIFAEGKFYGILSARGVVSFKQADADNIYEYGLIPLPPYIRRQPEEKDSLYYQTVYAAKAGALAAPTAGLHFETDQLKELAAQGINLAYVTLHVGLGTFRPVRTDNVFEHKMDAEYFQVPPVTQALIESTKKNKGRIIAVGTTTLRSLESFALGKKEGETNLFIYPGFEFKLTDALLTNFHLPRTTLFMLVCAFAGTELAKNAYLEAVSQKYRFYSYGDAMLII